MLADERNTVFVHAEGRLERYNDVTGSYVKKRRTGMFFRNVNSRVKRNIAKIMAGVTAASAIMGFGMHQVYGGNETTLEDILGNLYPYGIVANELDISSDLESNFATNVLYVSGHATGNAAGRMTNVGGVMYAREIRSASEKWSDEDWASYGDLKIRSGNYIITGEDYKRVNDGTRQIDNQYYWWKNETGKITINDEMSKQLQIVNDADYLNITEEKKRVLSILNSLEIDAGKEDFTDGIIDVTDFRKGIVTVNYDITNGVNNNLTVKKNSDQLLVINAISGKNTVNDSNMVAKYLLSVDGGEAKATLDNMEAHKVIWNFGIYKGKLTLGDNGGVFVAPNAKITNCGTSSGYLIAGSFSNSSGEWHHWNNSLKEETTAETSSTDIKDKETTTEQPPATVPVDNGTTEQSPTTVPNENGTTVPNENGTTEQPPTTVPVDNGTTEQPPTTVPVDNGTTEQPPTTVPVDNGTTEQPPTTVPNENGTTVPNENGTTEQPPTTVPNDNGTTEQPPATVPNENGTTEQPTTTDEVIHITDRVPNENNTTIPQDTKPEETQTSPEEIVDINGEPPLGNDPTTDNEKDPSKEEPTTEYDPDEELIQIDDLIPLGAPQTGDHSRIYLYIALAAAALGISILSVVLGKKKDKK